MIPLNYQFMGLTLLNNVLVSSFINSCKSNDYVIAYFGDVTLVNGDKMHYCTQCSALYTELKKALYVCVYIT